MEENVMTDEQLDKIYVLIEENAYCDGYDESENGLYSPQTIANFIAENFETINKIAQQA